MSDQHVQFLARLAFLLIVGAILPGGCSGQSNPSKDIGPGPRIISYSATITRTLNDLGLGDRIVAVGLTDPAAPDDLPRVGHFMKPGMEKLLALEPTDIFVMAGSDQTTGIEAITKLGQQQGYHVHVYAYPRTVQAVLDMIYRLPSARSDDATPSLGEIMQVEQRARVLREKLQAQLNAMRDVIASDSEDRPEVLLLFAPASDPGQSAASTYWGVGGRAVYGDLLQQYLQADNVAGGYERSAVEFGSEQLLGMQPEVVLFIGPEQAPLTDLKKDERVALLRGLDIPAVKTGRIYLVTHPHAMLHEGSAIAEVSLALAKALYPKKAQSLEDRWHEVSDTLATSGDEP